MLSSPPENSSAGPTAWVPVTLTWAVHSPALRSHRQLAIRTATLYHGSTACPGPTGEPGAAPRAPPILKIFQRADDVFNLRHGRQYHRRDVRHPAREDQAGEPRD